MKRQTLIEAIVFVLLFVSGSLLRLGLQDWPNFAPVAAIALFSGFFFRSWIVAAILPPMIMSTTDYWIGGYDRPMMLLVYGSLMLPVACRGFVRGQFGNPQRSAWKSLAGLLGSSLLASISFFLITNFGAWMWFDMYDRSISGIIQCYIYALPFFRHTLAADLFFACVLLAVMP